MLADIPGWDSTAGDSDSYDPACTIVGSDDTSFAPWMSSWVKEIPPETGENLLVIQSLRARLIAPTDSP